MSYSDFDSGPDYLAPMAQDDEIGARVREVRGSATQEAFGKRLGVSRGAEGNPPLAYIKRFVRHNDAELILEQFNPAKELRFPHDTVVSVHYIVLGGTPT